MSTPPSANTPAPETATVPPTTAAAEAARRPAAAANAVTRPPAPAGRGTSLRAVALATIAVLVVVAVVARPRRPPADEQGSAGQSTETQEPSTDRDSSAPPSVAAPAASSTSTVGASAAHLSQGVAAPPAVGGSLKKIPAKPAKPLAAASATAPPAPSPVAGPRNSETSAAKGADAEPSGTAPALAPPSTEIAGLAPVTITGCLEVNANEDRFRLTDAAGQNTPKARSWRTGFLKKRSASVNLVGVSDGPALEKQVGKRVAATGVLTSSDLKVSSVRVVSPSCN